MYIRQMNQLKERVFSIGCEHFCSLYVYYSYLRNYMIEVLTTAQTTLQENRGAAGSRQQGADSDRGMRRTGGYGWLVLRVSFYLSASQINSVSVSKYSSRVYDISYKHYQCDLLNFNVIYSAEVLLKMCWHYALFCHPSLETNDVAVKWKGRRNEGVFLHWIFLFAEC